MRPLRKVTCREPVNEELPPLHGVHENSPAGSSIPGRASSVLRAIDRLVRNFLSSLFNKDPVLIGRAVVQGQRDGVRGHHTSASRTTV